MRIIFIADAHIKGLEDKNQKSLAEFLEAQSASPDLRPDKVVFLGDIFDFWTGFNSVVYHKYLPLLNALLTLRDRGVKILYLEGNHDFAMGRFFTEVLGADVHADNCRLSLEGKELFLAHGDAISMSFGYATWRGFLRSRLFRVLKRLAGPGIAIRVADMLSSRSRGKAKRGEALDRRLKEFAKRRVLSGFDAVVLGHSHVPGAYIVGDESKSGLYANPGSWTDGTYLVYDKGEFKVERA